MGRKHRHRKKKYYSITDRPSFKIVGSIVTAVAFILLYYLIVILMENPGLALVCTVPCVLLVIWVSLKQRYFWWIWLLGACPCVMLMAFFRNPVVSFIIQTVYWVITYAMCQWMIMVDSRAKHRARMKRPHRRHHHHHHSDEPPAPRPKDELLEKLFADSE